MCGIVAYVGDSPAVDFLIEGLSRLEYRGYDSAGVATLSGVPAHTDLLRVRGKVHKLRDLAGDRALQGTVGLAHTRWATHGCAAVHNSHPHHHDGVSVVHNGIIENHARLRRLLEADGHRFSSDTDSEVIAHLFASARAGGADPLEALRDVVSMCEGAWAIAIVDERDPEQILFARRGSPLVVGAADEGMLLASDGPALAHRADEILFLEDGDHGVLRTRGVEVYDARGQPALRAFEPLGEAERVDRAGHPHFMHKEIFEQPVSVARTLSAIQPDGDGSFLEGIDNELVAEVERVIIVACGTSFHAGLVGEHLIEQLARVPVEVELASEFRYRAPILNERTLVLGVSQSGETADTLAALEEAQRLGAPIAAICNVRASAIARLCVRSAGVLHTEAGVEIGVASTKAFSSQLVALHLLALLLAERHDAQTDEERGRHLVALATAEAWLDETLANAATYERAAELLDDAQSMLYLGRGPLHAVALEGALKMTEISYVHAQGFAAGEMKHGPIALIEDGTPVVVLAPEGELSAKVIANLEEVRSRGANVIVVGAPDNDALAGLADVLLPVPAAPSCLHPLLYNLPLQLLAYHAAVRRGCDVDQPRNLAKSVTVE
jgi:glucosamine--fructose-6-phosphate aminotransferase (isomerizing)